MLYELQNNFRRTNEKLYNFIITNDNSIFI